MQMLSKFPALLFALLFGEYHEALIDSKINKGINPFDASREAVYKHLSLILRTGKYTKNCDIQSVRYYDKSTPF